jgi:hypothetical protein
MGDYPLHPQFRPHSSDAQRIASDGVTDDRLWEMGDIVDVLESWEQSQTKGARHDTQETR